MQQTEKRVLVIGGGVAGLAAAHALARGPVSVDLVEKSDQLGGHAIQYACKATDACVKCGACMAEERRSEAAGNARIRQWLGTQVASVARGDRLAVSLAGADGRTDGIDVDAAVVATGFTPYAPAEKPYGWGRFPNVITNLEMERMLHDHDAARRPSDGRPATRIAFVQCVGSRDASLGHLWCSRVCCGSALRMARRIQARQPDAAVHVFYIDVQRFGKDFHPFYTAAENALTMVRIIPGDIIPLPDDQLQIGYFDPVGGNGVDGAFDLFVLSVGMLPGADTAAIAGMFDASPAASGFFPADGGMPAGVFAAGAATGPMSIPEAISSGRQAAWHVQQYLSRIDAT